MAVPSTAAAAATPHRQILALALPAIGGLAADPLLSLVDTALVGRLGAIPLAALGIDAAVFTTVFWLFNFLTYGTTSAVARLMGEGAEADASSFALQSLWLAVALGAVVTTLLLVTAPHVVRLMGASEAAFTPALAYMRVRALAATPVLVVAVAHGAFRGLHDTRTPMLVAIGANTFNAVVSWLLIYRAGLGVVGAAWGTVMAQTAAALVFLALARARFPRPSMVRPQLAALRAILRVSVTLFVRTAALLAGLLVTTAIAARMGTVVVASHQVARELWSMLALVLDGFAVAGQALVATALGTGAPDRARADARRLVLWGLAAGSVIGIGYLALAGLLPPLFTDDPRVLASVRRVWPIVAVLQPVGGVVFVLDGVLFGAGDFRFLMLSSVAASLLGLVPVALAALEWNWGLVGIWAGMAALLLIRLAAVSWRLRDGAWLRPSSVT